MSSPSSKVERLGAQRGNERCPHGSPSGLRDNYVVLLHLEKSADLLHIRTRRDHSRPPACQRVPFSPLCQLPVGKDPKQEEYTFSYLSINSNCS